MADPTAALRLRQVFYREADPGWQVDRHHHDVHQWYACLRGCLRVRLGERIIELGAERSLIVPPMQDRELLQAGRSLAYVVAIFHPGGIDLEQIAGRVLALPPGLRADFHALVEEMHQPGVDSSFLVQALLGRLLIGLKRALVARGDPSPVLSPLNAGSHAEVVRAVDAFLAAHLAQPIHRAEIAAAVRLSAAHLARIYRAAAGRTILDQLTALRIARAKALLLESTLSVTQIAGAVGIVSFSHFARTFRCQVGISPSDYRRTGGLTWVGQNRRSKD